MGEDHAMLSHFIFRVSGAAILGCAGWWTAQEVGKAIHWDGSAVWGISAGVVGAILGSVVMPYVTIIPIRNLRRTIQEAPTARIVAGIAGLTVGLLIAGLISTPLARLPGWPGTWVPVILSVAFSYTGLMLMLAREQDFSRFLPSTNHLSRFDSPSNGQIVVDTSVIIDGRIADISQAGFINGTLIVPRFVLDELRHIADSSDALRRNRGRRGLEMLNKLRKEAITPIQVLDVDHWDGMEVDGKLIKLANSLGAPIVTMDFNLNRVAEIEGVQVLNINELANALKSVVLPGEDLLVQVIQEGKEAGQGVGFLDDGTMVVVENGRRYLDTSVDVAVTRVLQTAAGRLIFAQPREQ
ncbi:PIN domain nuclease [Dehalococcoidia bacterium]|nr:PIN domain nuclease [Dehalococcoidia bacterium]